LIVPDAELPAWARGVPLPSGAGVMPTRVRRRRFFRR
jgi:hypothetical protein